MNTEFRKFIEGSAGESDVEKMMIRLAANPEDDEISGSLEEFFDSLEPSPEDDGSAREALSSINSRLRGSKRRNFLNSRAAAFAAGFAIPVLLLSSLLLLKPDRQQTWSEKYIPFGQTETITLSDGTSLTLNSGSRVTYPDFFVKGERRIFVDGEVYADVARDEDAPFIIESGNLQVKVLGTVFDLKSYSEDDNAQLMLFEGAVNMKANADSVIHELIVHPGENVTYDKLAGDMTVRAFDEDAYRPFTENGSIHFFNERLSDVARELERRFGVKVMISDSSLAETHYYAHFTNCESLDEILASLNSDRHFRIKKSDGIVYITKR